MKKLAFLFVTVIMLMLFAVSASAERYWFGIYPLTEDDFAYEIINQEAIIRGYAGSDSKIVIPNEIEGCPVTTIGMNAFHNETSINEVTIPDTVTKIEDDAFSRCYNLHTINMSQNISHMGYTVFWGTQWYNNYAAGELIYIGNILYEFEYENELILDQSTTYILNNLLTIGIFVTFEPLKWAESSDFEEFWRLYACISIGNAVYSASGEKAQCKGNVYASHGTFGTQ